MSLARLRKIKNFVRNVFARETLGEAPPSRAPSEARRSLTAMLFASEPLPLDAEPRRKTGPGLLRFLFGAEVLPEDPPEPARPRAGLLRAVFAPEPLPELSAAPPGRRRAAWLRWLFRFEHLDPP